jgi:hypothetical protein
VIKVERRKIEGMNQLKFYCIYTWKCHNETPCIAILKNKNAFFKKQRTGRENRSCLGIGTSWRG